MITSEDPHGLAADLSKMTVRPVSRERAEEILAEDLVWLPQGEPRQCIAEDCAWEVEGTRGPLKVHRRTLVARRQDDRLRIMVEVALLRPDGIEMERRRFEEPSGEAERYLDDLRQRLAASAPEGGRAEESNARNGRNG